jgi:hypothetical protein
MAKQLAALLGGGLDLKALAEMLRRQGRGQDTILAHITPQEAALLKSRGGAGTMNPDTGLPEFQQNYPDESYSPTPSEASYYPPNMPLDTVGKYRQMEGEYSTEPQSSIYTPVPYTSMRDATTPDFTQFFDYSTGSAPMQAQAPQADFTQHFDYSASLPPSLRSPLYFGDGMTGAATEAYDRGLPSQAPSVRELADMAKSGAKQVFEGLKTPGGAALGNALIAGLQARRGFKEARAMENELRQLGQAPRQVGQEQLGAGMRGELTPVQRQQIAAFQAQQRQALANMGQRSGTAQQQLGARTVEMQQRGAQDLINQGLKNIGISDKYLQQAILAGYQADTQVGTALGEALRASGNLLAGQPSNEVAKPVQTPATQQKRTALSSLLGG